MARHALVIALASLALLALPAAPAHAAVIIVDTTDDEFNTDGDCSLREAIEAANSDLVTDACDPGVGPDTITIPVGLYELSTGQLVADSNLTLSGAGAATTIIDANDTSRILKITAGSTVEVSGLTIRDGNAQDSDGTGIGRVGGGIVNRGTLTLTNSTVADNTVATTADSAHATGGGIWSLGPLTSTNSTISGNAVTASGMNASATAGGILAIFSSLSISDSTVSGNSADDGAGGISSFGTLTITNTIVGGNTTAGSGGGISTGCCSATSGTITDSTISMNSAGAGGGVFTQESLTLTNTDVTDNTGGGIRNNGELTLTGGTTLSGNSAGAGDSGGNLYNAFGATATLSGTPVNGGSAVTGGGIWNQGTLTLNGVTLNGNTASATGGGLHNFETVEIIGGSVSMNTSVTDGGGIWNNGIVTADGTTISDNMVTGPAPDFVTNGGGIYNGNAGQMTLDGLLISDNSAASSGGGLFLQPSDTAMVTLTDSTVSGNTGGAAVDSRATLEVAQSTITANTGEGIHSEKNLMVTNSEISDNTATGIGVLGGPATTVLDGLTITGNGGTISGGVSNGNAEGGASSDMTITDSTISGNGGVAGGGVNNFADAGTLTIERTTISGNTATDAGGGIYNLGGTLVLNSSTVSGNTASGGPAGAGGGGIENLGGTATIMGSTVSGNSHPDAGGGIHNGGDLSLIRSTVSGNTTMTDGGGIATGAGTLTLVDSTITGNDATSSAGGIWINGGSATLTRTILAGDTSASGQECSSGTIPLTSGGYNLVETPDTCFPPVGTDLTGEDPSLGPLADNGDPTFTHELMPDSLAIDAAGGGCASTDQRGVPRPQGAACDIGAFETTPPSSTIGFPANGGAYQTPAFAAGCADATPDVCGTGMENPDIPVPLTTVDLQLRRTSDGRYWDGDSWETPISWFAASGTYAWDYGIPLGEDGYTLRSRATDEAGYMEGTASATFTVDDTAPETTVTSGPDGPTGDDTPAFTFSSNEQGTAFGCRVDGASFTPCSGPGASHTTAPLADGPHTLEVRATDAAGNIDATPAARSFTVDTAAPNTKITKKPKKKTFTAGKRKRVRFAFETSEDEVSFLCKIDGRPWKPCDSPFRKRLKQGRHRFLARATDAAGNVEPTPARWRFRILEA